jgi:hypothetical protein
VKEQRWPWLLTAGLMLASAVAAAWSTYLYWLPCRGSMLSGLSFGYHHGGPDFSDACSWRMDGDIAYEVTLSELNIVSMGLLGVAWLTLVIGLRWQWRTRVLAALPGLATLAGAVAVAMTIGDLRYEDAPLIVLATIELVAIVALFWIAAWQPEVRGRYIRRLLVVLWGTTAFGLVHLMTEYVIMGRLDRSNLGYGYLTVAVITISAILTVIMTLRAPPKGAEDEPHQDEYSGSVSLA